MAIEFRSPEDIDAEKKTEARKELRDRLRPTTQTVGGGFTTLKEYQEAFGTGLSDLSSDHWPTDSKFWRSAKPSPFWSIMYQSGDFSPVLREVRFFGDFKELKLDVITEG
jgi:hypothetical protein